LLTSFVREQKISCAKDGTDKLEDLDVNYSFKFKSTDGALSGTAPRLHPAVFHRQRAAKTQHVFVPYVNEFRVTVVDVVQKAKAAEAKDAAPGSVAAIAAEGDSDAVAADSHVGQMLVCDRRVRVIALFPRSPATHRRSSRARPART